MQLELPYSENSPPEQSNLSALEKNAVGVKDIVPGQSDSSIGQFLRNWMTINNRKLPAACCIYAGFLGATSPQQSDYDQPEIQKAAYSEWLANCTARQVKILNFTHDLKKQKQREQGRADYAQDKLDKTGDPVRAYVKARSAEEKNQRNAAKQKRHREKLKLAGPKPIDPQMVDELNALLATCPDIPLIKAQ